MSIEPLKDLGPTGRKVAENIKRVRESKNLTFAELARQLTESGRAMQPLALRRIEAGGRRVDADDLVALAVVLDVSPLEILLPGDGDKVEATAMPGDVTYEEVWAWARGEAGLSRADRWQYWRSIAAKAFAEVEKYERVIADDEVPSRIKSWAERAELKPALSKLEEAEARMQALEDE